MGAWRIPQDDLEGWIASRAGELWAATLDAVDDMVFVKDLEGHFVYNNAAHLDFLGRARDEVTGKTDFDLFTSEEAEGFFAHDTRLLASHQPVVSPHPATDPQGRPVVDVAFKHVVRRPDDEVLGLVGIVKRVLVGADHAACADAIMATVTRTLGEEATPSQLSALRQSVDAVLAADNLH